MRVLSRPSFGQYDCVMVEPIGEPDSRMQASGVRTMVRNGYAWTALDRAARLSFGIGSCSCLSAACPGTT